MHTSEWVIHELGRLAATVSVGFQSLHYRMDDRDRFARERHREVMGHVRRLDRAKSNGGSIIPYAKIAAVLGMIILGALGHMAPEAVRAGISAMIPSLIKALVSG